MPQLVKNLELTQDRWTFHASADDVASLDHAIVPFETWLERRDEAAGVTSGFWIDGDAEPDDFAPYLGEVAVVAINFPAFVDGRGLSLATLLRGRYQYAGELRAVGQVLPDLASYLHRSGFDAVAYEDRSRAETAVEAAEAMSDYYQASVVEPEPPFRRLQLA